MHQTAGQGSVEYPNLPCRFRCPGACKRHFLPLPLAGLLRNSCLHGLLPEPCLCGCRPCRMRSPRLLPEPTMPLTAPSPRRLTKGTTPKVAPAGAAGAAAERELSMAVGRRGLAVAELHICYPAGGFVPSPSATTALAPKHGRHRCKQRMPCGPRASPEAAVTASAMHTAMAMVPPRLPPKRDRPQQKAAATLCSRYSTHRRPRIPSLRGSTVGRQQAGLAHKCQPAGSMHPIT